MTSQPFQKEGELNLEEKINTETKGQAGEINEQDALLNRENEVKAPNEPYDLVDSFEGVFFSVFESVP